MNLAHLHLLLNHFPIIGSALAVPLLAIAAWRTREWSAILAPALVLIIAGVCAVAANLTGEPAEEVVEDRPGVSERWIHEHEEHADVATGFAVVGAVGAGGLLYWASRKGETPRLGVAGLLVLTLGTNGMMAWTGLAGGRIHHPELRPGASEAPPEAEGGEEGPRRGKGKRGQGGRRGGPGRRDEAREAGERREAGEPGTPAAAPDGDDEQPAGVTP